VQSETDIESDQWLHAPLDSESNRCLGIDIDKTGIKKMQQQSYDVTVGDAQDFVLDETFDVIVAGEIIEHLTNPGGLFKSSKEHLCDGGLLIITTPNPFALVRFFTYISPFHDFQVFKEHVSWFDRTTLKQFAKRYNFIETDYHFPVADSFGITQLFHMMGINKFEDDFIGVYRLRMS
jgi:2-polyprenyl-3-methyl-5-hydroxy-6-metoxy-1,4-benzoquinol methylase